MFSCVWHPVLTQKRKLSLSVSDVPSHQGKSFRAQIENRSVDYPMFLLQCPALSLGIYEPLKSFVAQDFG